MELDFPSYVRWQAKMKQKNKIGKSNKKLDNLSSASFYVSWIKRFVRERFLVHPYSSSSFPFHSIYGTQETSTGIPPKQTSL